MMLCPPTYPTGNPGVTARRSKDKLALHPGRQQSIPNSGGIRPQPLRPKGDGSREQSPRRDKDGPRNLAAAAALSSGMDDVPTDTLDQRNPPPSSVAAVLNSGMADVPTNGGRRRRLSAAAAVLSSGMDNMPTTSVAFAVEDAPDVDMLTAGERHQGTAKPKRGEVTATSTSRREGMPDRSRASNGTGHHRSAQSRAAMRGEGARKEPKVKGFKPKSKPTRVTNPPIVPPYRHQSNPRL